VIENGISRVQNVDSALVQLGNGRMKDMKFLDDEILLILWDSNGKDFEHAVCVYADHRTGTRILLSLPYYTLPTDMGTSQLKYSPYMQKGGPYSPTVFNDEEVTSQLSKLRVPNHGSFIPEKIEIRERSRRRDKDDTRRIVLLRDDKLHYKVFKFSEDTRVDGDVSMS
jgi:anaphase-promoting complex subunit 4